MAKNVPDGSKIIGAAYTVEKHHDYSFMLSVKRKRRASKKQVEAADKALLNKANKRLNQKPRAKQPRFLAAGDSWINILTDFPGQPDTFVDAIDKRYYVRNVGWPGQTFDEAFLDFDRWMQPLKSATFKYFIFSGGGVDFFGGTNMSRYVHPFASVPPGSPDSAYIIHGELDAFLESTMGKYDFLAKQAKKYGAKLVMQGYDYSIPRQNGHYLGRRFTALGYTISSGLPKKIIVILVNKFYRALGEVADKNKAFVLDFRNEVGARWHDEIHPNDDGAAHLGDFALGELGLLTSTSNAKRKSTSGRR